MAVKKTLGTGPCFMRRGINVEAPPSLVLVSPLTPGSAEYILLSGDEQSGTDRLKISGS